MLDYYLIEILAPRATTYNFTVQAEDRAGAIAAARNLGVEPINVRLYDQPYRLNEPIPPWV